MPLWPFFWDHSVSYSHVMIMSLRELASQPAITCLKLTIETLEQVVKYVQS